MNGDQLAALILKGTPMKARLIQNVDGLLIPSTFEGPIENIIAAFEVRGYEFTGLNMNPRQRAELQGKPKFKGIAGPMFDGDAVRYEDAGSYAALSA